MYQNIPTKCLTGEVRLSYVHLDQPHSNNGGDPKYGVTLLIPKNDIATAEDLNSSMSVAYENGVMDLWKGSRPVMRYPVIYDGDGTRPSGEPFGPECKGHWVLSATSKQKPQCVHISNIHSELLPSDVYSGMYARVTINFFPYDASGNRGVGCGLRNVCKTRDGEPLGGFANAESDFAGLEQAAPQQPSYTAQQQTYGAPQQPQNYAAPQQGVNPLTGLPW